jgi:hypothetical protein
MPASVKNGGDDNLTGLDTKVDRERKSPQQSAARVSVHHGISWRPLNDRPECREQFVEEVMTEARAASGTRLQLSSRAGPPLP